VRYQCKREAQRPANKSAIRIALTQLIYLLETSDEECITNGISIVAATRKAHEMLARLHDNGTDPAAIERKTRYLFSALRLDK
jgi:hypothetical protein